MLKSISALTPIEMILQSIFYQFLTNATCLSIVTDQNLDVHFLPKLFMYINVKDEDTFAINMLSASELGCSDYIVQMNNPELFMNVFEENIYVGNARRSDRKLLFVVAANEHKNTNDLLNILKMKGAKFVANVLLVVPTEETIKKETECETYKLVTHKFVGSEDNQAPLILDTWDSCSGKFELNSNVFPHVMNDMQGKILRLACFTYKPYVLLDLEKSVAPLGYDGTDIRIVIEFCRWINCTIELVRDDDGQWGEIFENRTGNGVIGNLVQDRADIGVTALYAWFHEYGFLDLSMPVIRTGVTCVAPAPRLMPRWELPLMAFSWTMWGAVVLTFALASLALTLAQCGSTDKVLLTTFGMLVTQAQPESAMRPGLRSVVVWLLMTGLVLDNAYSGGLASVFTIPKYERSIETVQDLVDAKVEWGATHDAWIFSILQARERNLVQLVKKFTVYKEEELRTKGFSRDYAFSIERLPAGHYAIGEYVTEEAVPHLKLMQEDIYWEQCVAMARKSSPYTNKFNQLLSRLHSSGILLAWETQVVLQHSNYKVQLGVRRSQTPQQEVEIGGLDLRSVMGIFFLLALGEIAAAMVFIGELIYASRTSLEKRRPR